jgi:N-formylglutamate amidohydrolase
MYEPASPLTPSEPVDSATAPPPARLPYDLIEPHGGRIPFVLSSPHSGAYYPAELQSQSRLDEHMLRLSEDSYVDELFSDATALGAPLLRAVYSRAYVDPNREPYELDPAMFADPLPDHVNSRSERVAIGFGTVAREVARGISIYRGKLRYADALSRIEQIYFPYHRALERLLEETRARFGYAVLIDCHSMPSNGFVASGRRGAPDIVLGDRFGQSCGAALTAEAESALRAMGYKVERNQPYAGGFITEQYGRPDAGLHALQIEINRRIYMDERTLARRPGFERIARDMSTLIGRLSECNLRLSNAHNSETVRL